MIRNADDIRVDGTKITPLFLLLCRFSSPVFSQPRHDPGVGGSLVDQAQSSLYIPRRQTIFE